MMIQKNQYIEDSQAKLTMPNESWVSLKLGIKSRLYKNIKIVAVMLFLLLLIILTCFKINTFISNDSHSQIQDIQTELTTEHLNLVSNFISHKFRMGSWRYVNSEIIKNEIRVFIQIPEKLQIDKQYQQNYIQKAICPNKAHSIWQHLSPSQLEIHLFTGYKHNSIYAFCA
ncbi:hypothetical protein [Pseudoalteromonas denitrificans]|uniref:Uncharacterized protein n=1 Tax=Pseudoalteromonas denitrificans DSM 6059 TaxID=1123010 RepID=A0A1I1P4S8_9GAMM|nr:hypothetical protein [Pseudoalteromonas denitrificans]SFD04951.1 hypothetical protein SAMN02745724_03315 [Pseudoalteromonas denitrificans DSM 6059]